MEKTYKFEEEHGEEEEDHDEFKITSRSNSRWKKCCICCAVTVVILILVVLVGGFATHRYLNSLRGANETDKELDEELNEFFKTWEAPEHIRKGMYYTFGGFDKKDQPVWLSNFGRFDLASILDEEENKEIMTLFADQSVYRIRKSQRLRPKNGANATLWGIIVNMDGYSYSQAFDFNSIGFLKDYATKNEEILRSLDYAIVINMNGLARILLSIMKPLLGSIMEAVHPYGYDEEEWQAALLEIIDRDQLPEEYGGFKNFTPIAVYD